MADPFLSIVRCPRCGGELVDTPPLDRCSVCRTAFPSIDGIPWLFAEPEQALADWRHRLHYLLSHLERESQRIRAELEHKTLKATTRTRLKLLASSYQDQSRRLQALLAAIIREARPAPELHAALRTELPLGQGIASYYSNIHRDWVWGDDENEASFRRIAAALGERPLGNTLVLGAGACRLAFDVHRRLSPPLTVAADINPLLLLVAQRVLKGEKVALYEFPIAPRSAEENAVLRSLSAPGRCDERLKLVFADALRAPFAPGAFDAVITPWFIDIIAEDFCGFAPRVNRLLRPDGVWVNFGSLAFSQVEVAKQYSLEEVLECVSEAGFQRTYLDETEIPYMRSPASRHSRVESVISFAATKVREVLPGAPPQNLPEWLTTGTLPVPLLPAFQSTALSTRIYGFVMSLIDGRRSVKDMASLLVEQRLMSADDAETTLRTFLTKMYDDSQRRVDF